MGFVHEVARIQLELPKGRTVILNSQVACHFWRNSLILMKTGVDISAFGIEPVVNALEFHNTLKWVLAGTGFYQKRFFGLLLVGPKHVIGIFVVFQFQIQIPNNLICVLYFFLAGFDFDVHFLLDLNQLFYLGKVLCPGGSFRK